MLIAHLIAFVALIIATHVDLKIREVPDLLSFGTIAVGIALGVMEAMVSLSFMPLVLMIAGLGLGFIIGCIMYYTGQWGGGDAKLLMGLGALFGVGSFFYNFLLYLILAGAVYGLGYGMYLALKNRKAFAKSFMQKAHTPKMRRVRMGFQVLIVLALVNAFFIIQDVALKLLVVIFCAGAYSLIYLILFSRALEESCMKVKIPVSKLVEGDWVLEEVKLGKKKLIADKTGITQEQIALLKKHNIKKVLVKEGIPFVPSFLLAYVVLILTDYAGINVFHAFF